MRTKPSSSMSILTVNSSSSPRIVSPPLPMIMPDLVGVDLDRHDLRGERGELARAAAARASAIRSRMDSRASRACDSARRRSVAASTPVILMSICRAVMPVRRAGDLEVHVAEVVLGALDVGQHDDVRRPP